MWSVEYSRYNEVIKTLLSDEFFATYHVVELPRFLLKGLKTFLHKLPPPSSLPEPQLSTFMMDTLLPFQLEGLKFVIARKGKAMIADEMVRLLVTCYLFGYMTHFVLVTISAARISPYILSILCMHTFRCILQYRAVARL